MKAIHATPKEVQRVFTDNYIIPDFQRPYSWEREQCEILWDDFTTFFNSANSDEKYFLGNIVIHPAENGKFSVIDGQQRLTTLLLLIKALFTRAGTAKILEGCLRIQNKLTSEMTDDLRICSEVIAEDKTTLTEIILHNVQDDNKSKLAENYRFFIDKIDTWRNTNSAEEFNKLIETLLYNVVLLPIECGSEDDALTIFETINNRGMSLSDADIFKAKLYHNVPKDKQSTFISNWSALNNPDWLFRIYMHIIRASKGDTGKEIGLRAYFTPREMLSDWNTVLASLKKIQAIDTDNFSDNNDYSIVNSLWAILDTYPNQYWNYPLYVFLHKHGAHDDINGFTLSEKRLDELNTLLEETVRYFLIKGVVHNAANAVKDVTFRVCDKIANGGDYLAEYKAAITVSDRAEMLTRLENNRLGRYMRGLVLLTAYLNKNQDRAAFVDLVYGKYDIEHILPKKWNNFDGWTEDSWAERLNTLGNLMPLEREINISASNEFLKRKKAKYRDSKIQDAQDIASNIADDGWVPSKMDDIYFEKLLRLSEFFGLEK